jgi:hypothetical protein
MTPLQGTVRLDNTVELIEDQDQTENALEMNAMSLF